MARFPFVIKWRPKVEERATYSDNFDLKGLKFLDYFAGGKVTKERAMKFTAVLAAVSLRSQLVGSFPKVVYDQTPEGRKQNYVDPMYKMIAYTPNPYMNGFTFWELMNTYLDLWGNAYAYISRYNGSPSNLFPVHPRNVEVAKDSKGIIYKVRNTGDSVLDKDHRAERFLHFKDISYDGLVGQSRISLANDAINIALAAEAFGKEFFEKGGNAKGIIKAQGQVTAEIAKNIRKYWNEVSDNGIPILDMGKEYQPLSIPMKDSQFIATREFQLQDIARIFHVPPYLIGDLSRATYSNVEQASIDFVKFGLRPLVKRYEQELEFKLLGDQAGAKTIRFNLDNILRGDTVAQTAFLSAMVQNKIFNRNEARAYVNKNAVPGGDVFENPATSSNTNTDGNTN